MNTDRSRRVRQLLAWTTSLLAISCPVMTGIAAPQQVRNGLPTLDLGGVGSWDALGSENNDRPVASGLLGGTLLQGISWDITIETQGGSWLSEVNIRFLDSPMSLTLTPGLGDDQPGTASYSSQGFVALDELAFLVPSDGLLRFEVYESFDDQSGTLDALFLPGSFLQFQTTLTPPTPGTGAALMTAAIIASRRRR